MQTNNTPSPATGFFESDRLELTWLYAYQPEFIPLLLSYLGIQPAHKVLDSGCGSGFLARLLANAVSDLHITAFDADTTMLGHAQTRFQAQNLTHRVQLLAGDAYKLPFPDNYFDVATSHTLF